MDKEKMGQTHQVSPESRIFHDYPTYVTAAAEALSRNAYFSEEAEKILFPEEGESLPLKDSIISWIDLVSFDPEAVQSLTSTLQPVRGLGIQGHLDLEKGSSLEKDFSSGTLPHDLISRTDRYSLLSGVAVSKAKLLSIRELAEGTYPTLIPETEAYLKYLDQVVSEVLQSSRPRTSIMETLSSPRLSLSRPGWAGLSLVVIAALLLSGCQSGDNRSPIDTLPTQFPTTDPGEPTTDINETAVIEASPTSTVEILPTHTQIPTKISPTPTELPTSTPTEIIPQPQEAIEQLHLNSDREYSFVDGYLVDNYNQAKMARWDASSHEWVNSTLEEKYGHLAVTQPSFPYPEDNNMYVTDGTAELGDYIVGHIYSVKLNSYWTGNIEQRIVDGIDVWGLETVFRDRNGVLNETLIAYAFPEENKQYYIFWGDPGDEEFGQISSDSFTEIVSHLYPGIIIERQIPIDWTSGHFPPESSDDAADVYENYRLYEIQREELQKFIQIQEGESVELSDDLIIPPGALSVKVSVIVDSDTWNPPE